MTRAAFTSAGVATECLVLVAPAEQAFTSRWRLSTLKRVDPSLHELLREQQDLYSAALVTGTDVEAREQSQAMVRGWKAACACLEAGLVEDDAYQVGVDGRTGTHIVIAHHVGAKARVQDHPRWKGISCLFYTPDELAALVAGMAVLQAVKVAFPDAEILEGPTNPTGEAP